MTHDVPLVLPALTGVAVMMLVAGAMWPRASSFAVRWPAVTASALFFGFVLSSVFLSEKGGNAFVMLIASSLIFLSLTTLFLLTSQFAEDATPEDKEHQK